MIKKILLNGLIIVGIAIILSQDLSASAAGFFRFIKITCMVGFVLILAGMIGLKIYRKSKERGYE